LHLGFPIHKRVELFGDFSYMSTEASMDSIMFAPLEAGVVAALPRDDVDFSTVHLLSNIEVERTEVSVGGNFTFKPGLLLQIGYSLIDYEDDDPILVDESGEYQVVFASLGWVF
jgi:hypothetical protein